MKDVFFLKVKQTNGAVGCLKYYLVCNEFFKINFKYSVQTIQLDIIIHSSNVFPIIDEDLCFVSGVINNLDRENMFPGSMTDESHGDIVSKTQFLLNQVNCQTIFRKKGNTFSRSNEQHNLYLLLFSPSLLCLGLSLSGRDRYVFKC